MLYDVYYMTWQKHILAMNTSHVKILGTHWLQSNEHSIPSTWDRIWGGIIVSKIKKWLIFVSLLTGYFVALLLLNKINNKLSARYYHIKFFTKNYATMVTIWPVLYLNIYIQWKM